MSFMVYRLSVVEFDGLFVSGVDGCVGGDALDVCGKWTFRFFVCLYICMAHMPDVYVFISETYLLSARFCCTIPPILPSALKFLPIAPSLSSGPPIFCAVPPRAPSAVDRVI